MDLVLRQCRICGEGCYIIPVEPADDPASYIRTTGLFVELLDGSNVVMCDECADERYQMGTLAYSGGSGAISGFIVQPSSGVP